MQLADTHTHLYLPDFDEDRSEMINRASESGVVKLLMPNIDIHSLPKMMEAADRYPGTCFPMVGLHPTSVKDDYEKQLEILFNSDQSGRFIAVGEIGIDLYWDKTFITEQISAFRTQLKYALERELPVAIHSREAFAVIREVLDEFSGKGLRGVFHAFSGQLSDVEYAIKNGFMLGIGGPVTYKNSTLPEIITFAGHKNIILETDSPYLTPVPFRGKRNESAYIKLINRKIAEILDITEDECAKATYNNSCRLFKIQP